MASGMEDTVPSFWIGHHEETRGKQSSSKLVQQAHAAGYDMVTSPITTNVFHSRVLTLLSSTQSNSSSPDGDANRPWPRGRSRLVVPPLSPVDTDLTPGPSMSQVIARTSSWVDLSSPDPVVSDVSKQVLVLEVAYAAFCGISYILVPGPKSPQQAIHRAGLLQYSRAVQEILAIGTYMQVNIWFPMIDHPENDVARMGDLAPFARPEFVHDDLLHSARESEEYGTWEAWNTIRSFCKYHARLSIALMLPRHLPSITIQRRWHSEPIRLLSIDSTSFLENVKGHPVLSGSHQTLINKFMRLRMSPWILLSNVGPIPGTIDSATALDPSSGLAPTLTLPTSSTGFPTLAEAAQGTHAPSERHTSHLLYMRNLQNRQLPQTSLEKFSSGYQDYLQAPLQPLTVNLESITYEVFEKDPVKYDWYEKAIARALHDWIEQGKPTSNPDGRVVVAVVGAGRGPLVARALRASDDVGVPIDMWVLEKNPNAFVLLQRHNADPEMWANRVHLVRSDMRTWRGPSRRKEVQQKTGPIGQALSPDTPDSINHSMPGKATLRTQGEIERYPIDIVISELLGSFADNELSPECLDGVQHLLNPVHGISIPASYTAHVTPIAAPRLHADIRTQALTSPNAFETPYVVMLHSFDYLSSISTTSSNDGNHLPDSSQQHPRQHSPTSSSSSSTPLVQQAWSFTHPDHHQLSSQPLASSDLGDGLAEPTVPITNAHNCRHTSLSFPIPKGGTCHGLAGYFEAVLYGSVELSTNPSNMNQKSQDMMSWFPIFFPLKTPIYVPSNSELVISMWRQTDDRKIWYEWIVEAFTLQLQQQQQQQQQQHQAPPAPTLSSLVSPQSPSQAEQQQDPQKPKGRTRWKIKRGKENDGHAIGGMDMGKEAAATTSVSPNDPNNVSVSATTTKVEGASSRIRGGDGGKEEQPMLPKATRIRIAATELHSSIAEACLM